jgi:hypothetical protein
MEACQFAGTSEQAAGASESQAANPGAGVSGENTTGGSLSSAAIQERVQRYNATLAREGEVPDEEVEQWLNVPG